MRTKYPPNINHLRDGIIATVRFGFGIESEFGLDIDRSQQISITRWSIVHGRDATAKESGIQGLRVLAILLHARIEVDGQSVQTTQFENLWNGIHVLQIASSLPGVCTTLENKGIQSKANGKRMLFEGDMILVPHVNPLDLHVNILDHTGDQLLNHRIIQFLLRCGS